MKRTRDNLIKTRRAVPPFTRINNGPISKSTAVPEAPIGKESSTSKIIVKTLVGNHQKNISTLDHKEHAPSLLGYAHQSNPELVAQNTFEETMNRYAIYFVSELNAKLSIDEKKSSMSAKRLKIVANTRDLLQYIDSHPHFSQIGFIVERPKCNKEYLPYHFSPILFDRASNVFVQLDSMGFCYPIPERAGTKFIHSPIERQFSKTGCLEDCIILPYFILTQFPDFFKFCNNKSKKDVEILEPFTQMKSLVLDYSAVTQDPKKLAQFMKKAMVQKQIEVLTTEGLQPLRTVHRLTEWPVELIMFLERYEALYPLRTKDKLGDPKNDPILKHLLQQGKKRIPGMEDAALRKHLILSTGKPNKEYDISGTNMDARHNKWVEALNQRYANIRLLFSKKLDELLVHSKEKQAIVDNIEGFVGTFNVPKLL